MKGRVFIRRMIDMNNEKEIKDKLLKLFEETDRQSDEQELYIQELRQRLSLAEKVCYEANGYLKSKDNPLGRIYLDRLAEAIEKWDSSRKNKGAQYLVMEDWEQCCGDPTRSEQDMCDGCRETAENIIKKAVYEIEKILDVSNKTAKELLEYILGE